MEPANEIIYDSMVSKITPFCPRFVPGDKTRFKLGDHTLSVCVEQSFILALNHFIDLIFENSWNELAGWIRHMSFGGIVQKGKDKLGSLADGIALATAAFMNGAGCVVDSRTVEENFGFLWNVSYIMEPVYEIARNFSDTREAVNQALKSGGWAPRTSRWIGGGFGLGGAIMGSITAGAMNMVGNAMHSTKNAAKSQILKWYTNSTLSKGQDAIKESEEFLLGFRTAWQDHIVRLHRALKSVMSEKCGFSDLQSPYDWGDELPFTFSVLNEQDALEALSHNVYDINAYVNLYSAHRELGRELCDLAEQCGILKEVGDAFVQQVDARVINPIISEAIGYDTPRQELEEKEREIDKLEKNNPVYQYFSTNRSVQAEQRFARKIRLFNSVEIISSMVNRIRNIRTTEEFLNLAEATAERGNEFEMELIRFAAVGFGQNDPHTLELLEQRGGKCVTLANQALEIMEYLACKDADLVNRQVKKMADSRIPLGMAALGRYYLSCKNEVLPNGKTKEAGVYYIKLAARLKSSLAMRYVGDWYRLGQNGFPRDKDLAEQYLLLASEMGDEAAKKSLAELQGGKK